MSHQTSYLSSDHQSTRQWILFSIIPEVKPRITIDMQMDMNEFDWESHIQPIKNGILQRIIDFFRPNGSNKLLIEEPTIKHRSATLAELKRKKNVRINPLACMIPGRLNYSPIQEDSTGVINRCSLGLLMGFRPVKAGIMIVEKFNVIPKFISDIFFAKHAKIWKQFNIPWYLYLNILKIRKLKATCGVNRRIGLI